MRPQHLNLKLSGQLPSWYEPVTEKLLPQITGRIVTECRPEKIILFGSYAFGNPKPQSDLDLLIVMNSHKGAFERHKQISGLFPQRLFALDLLVETPADVSHRLKIKDPFFRKILTQGRVLYERGNGNRVDSQSRRRLRKRASVSATAQKNLA